MSKCSHNGHSNIYFIMDPYQLSHRHRMSSVIDGLAADVSIYTNNSKASIVGLLRICDGYVVTAVKHPRH